MTKHCSILAVALVGITIFSIAGTARASIYPDAQLARDLPRLRTAISRIYELGIKKVLTTRERRAARQVRIEFPMQQRTDELLNFYAAASGAATRLILPVLSLKAVEDLATAAAWLHHTSQTFRKLDLYFAMLQRRPLSQFGPPGKRDILSVLGVPADALKTKSIDTLSLAFRNEAYLYIMAHELAHVLFRHKGLDQITTAQARADEVEADRFALDVMARTGTPPMGAVLFFTAQVFSLPHRGQFPTRRAWQNYLATASTHPLSADRVRAMARMIKTKLTARRPRERATWLAIGAIVDRLSRLLADPELYNCVSTVANNASVAVLRAPETSRKGFCVRQ